AVEQELLLEHAGLFNLYATRTAVGDEVHGALMVAEPLITPSGQPRRAVDSLRRNVEEFGSALRSFMSHAKVPLILCLCPRSPAAEADGELKAALIQAEESLLAAAGRIANVHTIRSALPLQRYPVSDYYDPHSHSAGHIISS